MGSMDHASMAKAGGCCCGMGAMTAEKPATMGGMSMPAKPQGGGLLPPTEKTAAGPSCGMEVAVVWRVAVPAAGMMKKVSLAKP